MIECACHEDYKCMYTHARIHRFLLFVAVCALAIAYANEYKKLKYVESQCVDSQMITYYDSGYFSMDTRR